MCEVRGTLDLEGYALGTLDSRARAQIEDHLQACESCREEVAGYEKVVELLPLGLPVAEPPGDLWGGIEARIEARPKAGLGRLLSAGALRQPRVLVPLAVALVAFLALNVAVAVLVVSGRLDGRWYDFRDLGIGVQALREWLDERTADQPQWMSDALGDHWLSYIVTALIGAIGILSFVGVVLLVLIWVERRLIGRGWLDKCDACTGRHHLHRDG